MEIKPKEVIRIGSRDSRLAVVQSELIMEALKEFQIDLKLELVTMKTTGDLILDKSLDKIGGKGLFVKELDLALLENRIDLSVHSLKDMPMELPEELPIVAYFTREDPRDVLVLPKGVKELPRNPILGSSSKRRVLQVRELYGDAVFKDIRGNVLTRLAKLEEGPFDGLILAAAGLKRLGLESRISRYFSPLEVIPAAGQGTLAVQGRRGEHHPCLEVIESLFSRSMAEAERAFVHTLNGGCSSPIAAYAYLDHGKLHLLGLYYEEGSASYITGEIIGDLKCGKELGIQLAKDLKERA